MENVNANKSGETSPTNRWTFRYTQFPQLPEHSLHAVPLCASLTSYLFGAGGIMEDALTSQRDNEAYIIGYARKEYRQCTLCIYVHT
jgi:hypothetical protein